ncbi:tRNA lysidine(34) synthetase [Aspergillus lucknowensis]|uniref:tRNA(Ile)-lysidine synthetase n=1 Tax=Aspergillus lucknowensis TaxID=176173 RepID=A0ABR4LJG8_9EURO
MAYSSLLRSTSTGAITLPQFTDVLHRTWLESPRFRHGGTTPVVPQRLGLAVSGGADSMALAYLCRQWEKEQHIPKDVTNRDSYVRVTAFIVDHKAREESTREANIVASWLREMGLRADILPLMWPDGHHRVSGSAFETHARRLRYRALGKACRARGIEALLMGHHQDDNVETTLWRLASGSRGAAGLTGIPALARIPECHGLYGVSGSGDDVTVHPDEFLVSDSDTGEQRSRSLGDGGPVSISTGGILICRPLLSFRKSSLVATCRENRVSFVEDPTNSDPALTPRNAIRSMLSTDVLPRALRNPSIIELIHRSQARVSDSHRISDEILKEQCRLLDLSFASGSLEVEFQPPSQSSESHPDPAPEPSLSKERGQGQGQEQNLSPQCLQEIQALTLRRITEFISPFPENHFPLSSFVHHTSRLFPPHTTPASSSLGSPSTSLSSPDLEKWPAERKSFTVGGVFFQPLPASKPSRHTTSDTISSTGSSDTSPTRGNKWLLTRQPYMRHRSPILRLPPQPLPLPRYPQPGQEPLQEQKQTQEQHLDLEKFYSPWNLWDSRFWIRVAVIPRAPGPGTGDIGLTGHDTQSHEEVRVVIRPLDQSDLAVIRQMEGAGKRGKKQQQPSGREGTASVYDKANLDVGAFLAELGRRAPGQSRFTVPVIAIEEDGCEKGRPVVLPTMDLMLPDPIPKAWTIRWEWKYKTIDLESLRLMGSIVANLTHGTAIDRGPPLDTPMSCWHRGKNKCQNNGASNGHLLSIPEPSWTP